MSSYAPLPFTPVPINRKKGIVSYSQLLKLANQFQLGRKAYSLFVDNGSKVSKAVKPIVAKHATDSCDKFCTSWRNLSATQQAGLVSLTHEGSRGCWGFRKGIGSWIGSCKK